ncbi:MAG: DUF302 domain-containing protein [bacterium]|nr:DUF302 domain-containing protein [bacterium]
MSNCSAQTKKGRGITTLASPYSFNETVRRLLAAFADKGIKVFADIDQQAEARAAGLDMPPTTLILFGNPKVGTPLMQAQPSSGLDLPLKVLISETRPGKVEVCFNTAAYILERHGLAAEFDRNIGPAEKLIAATLKK